MPSHGGQRDDPGPARQPRRGRYRLSALSRVSGGPCPLPARAGEGGRQQGGGLAHAAACAPKRQDRGRHRAPRGLDPGTGLPDLPQELRHPGQGRHGV